VREKYLAKLDRLTDGVYHVPMAKKQQGKRKTMGLAAVAGNRRAQHFAAGGTVTMWRGGRAVTITNKKRQASKTACRGKVEW